MAQARGRNAAMTEPIPYHEAISTAVGIAWWDMLANAADPQSFPGLNAGQSIECTINDFTPSALTEHRNNYSRPDGHGLSLAPTPAVTRVVRNNDDTLSALIGYTLA
jgi:hypothetical protein